jgi:hypothetical protein
VNVEGDAMAETGKAESWCWAESEDSEQWSHAGSSREDAIEYAYEQAEELELTPGYYGYIAKSQPVDVEKAARLTVDVDRLLEQMDESDDMNMAFDEAVFELQAPGAEAEAALQDALAAWAAKYVTANGKFLVSGKYEEVPPPPAAPSPEKGGSE